MWPVIWICFWSCPSTPDSGGRRSFRAATSASRKRASCSRKPAITPTSKWTAASIAPMRRGSFARARPCWSPAPRSLAHPTLRLRPGLCGKRHSVPHKVVAPESVTTLRVRYAETDRMGVVYYANYLVWFEVARADLMRSLGWTYREMEESGVILPVIEAHCEYRRPTRYDEEIEVRTSGRLGS